MQKSQLFKIYGPMGFVLLLSVLLLSSKTAGASLLNMKLSAPLQPHTTMNNLKISPDGQYALFVADDITVGAFELYSVPMNGDEPPTLLSSGLLPTGTGVHAFMFSPDSSRVIYIADQDSAGLFELYSVAIYGGPITKLNPPLTGAGYGVDSSYIQFTPDGNRVVFAADWQLPSIFELFSVPVGGGTPIRLNGNLTLNGTLHYYEITPDGSHVVYLANQDTVLSREIYIVPTTGGVIRKLNDSLPAGGSVQTFKMSPDGSRIVFTANQNNINDWEIFSVSVTDTNPTPIRLNPPLPSGKDVVFNRFEISPDSSRVVYLSDQIINDKNYFFSVPIAGGPSIQLTDLNSGTPELILSPTFAISPDSNWLVFRSKLMGQTELFSVPLDGGVVTKLNGLIIPVYGNVLDYQISPNSNRVVYLANQQSSSQEIYTVPIGGGTADKLNSALPLTGNIFSYQISDDSQRVIYVGDQQISGVKEIFSVPLADGIITKLNPPLIAGGTVSYFQISPNSNHVIYSADQETVGVRELFVTFEESVPPPYSNSIYMPFIQKQ